MNRIKVAEAILNKQKLYVEQPSVVPLSLLNEQWKALISVPKPVEQYITVAEACRQVVQASHALTTIHKLFPKGELALEDHETCRRAVGTFQMKEGVQEMRISWNHEGNEKWTVIFPSKSMEAGRPETATEVVAECESFAEAVGNGITKAQARIKRRQERAEHAPDASDPSA